MKFENEGESIEFICISFILIHLYKLFSERSRASVLECCGEQVAHSDTEQGTAAELTEHQGHLLEPQFTISVTGGVGILCDSPPAWVLHLTVLWGIFAGAHTSVLLKGDL